MQAYTKDKPNQIKTNSKKKEPRMNLLYLRFWSGNLVEFTAKSPMVDSDHETKILEGRERKGKKNKNELTLSGILIGTVL